MYEYASDTDTSKISSQKLDSSLDIPSGRHHERRVQPHLTLAILLASVCIELPHSTGLL